MWAAWTRVYPDIFARSHAYNGLEYWANPMLFAASSPVQQLVDMTRLRWTAIFGLALGGGPEWLASMLTISRLSGDPSFLDATALAHKALLDELSRVAGVHDDAAHPSRKLGKSRDTPSPEVYLDIAAQVKQR
jgi:hypothetical protein